MNYRTIACDTNFVLSIKCMFFEFLYLRMRFVIDEEGLLLGEQLDSLIKEMPSEARLTNCNVAAYINTKKDFALFAYILKRGIERDTWIMPAAKDTLERLWSFHAELLKYGEKLS